MDENTILKFLQGNLTTQERIAFLDWLDADSANKEQFKAIKKVWSLTSEMAQDINSTPDTEFKTFKYRHLSQEDKPNKYLLPYIRIAAIFVLSFGLSFLAYYLIFNEKSQSSSLYTEIETRAGEKSQITLPDGSRIWINACTKLRYPNDLTKDNIEMYLDGEAFFDLKKLPNRQITVRTSQINIKVLGTAFNLKSYRDDDVIETTLVRGQIAIEHSSGKNSRQNQVMLNPNQSATYFKGTNSLVTNEFSDTVIHTSEDLENLKKIATTTKSNMVVMDKINPETQISWKEGKLSFKKETFENLAKMMERWYDINIEINDDNLRKVRFSGSFDKETIEQALQALSYPVPFRYQIEKDTILIYSKVKP